MSDFILGWLSGVGTVLALLGAAQLLLVKGFDIALKLLADGWTPQRLQANRKLAAVLPLLESTRAQERKTDDQRRGNGG